MDPFITKILSLIMVGKWDKKPVYNAIGAHRDHLDELKGLSLSICPEISVILAKIFIKYENHFKKTAISIVWIIGTTSQSTKIQNIACLGVERV